MGTRSIPNLLQGPCVDFWRETWVNCVACWRRRGRMGPPEASRLPLKLAVGRVGRASEIVTASERQAWEALFALPGSPGSGSAEETTL